MNYTQPSLTAALPAHCCQPLDMFAHSHYSTPPPPPAVDIMKKLMPEPWYKQDFFRWVLFVLISAQDYTRPLVLTYV